MDKASVCFDLTHVAQSSLNTRSILAQCLVWLQIGTLKQPSFSSVREVDSSNCLRLLLVRIVNHYCRMERFMRMNSSKEAQTERLTVSPRPMTLVLSSICSISDCIAFMMSNGPIRWPEVLRPVLVRRSKMYCEIHRHSETISNQHLENSSAVLLNAPPL